MGGVLPLALFSGGHNYFVSQFAQRNGWEHGPCSLQTRPALPVTLTPSPSLTLTLTLTLTLSRWEPYSIHTTYQYAAAAGKRHRLREAAVWIDPPEYYDPPGGLLRFEIDQPG